MSYYANEIKMLSVATINAAVNGAGLNFGEYISGQLIIHITTLSGTNPRIYPTWAVSHNATGPSSGRYTVLRAFATSLRATGLAAMTLPTTLLGRWCRVQFTIGGTSAASKLGAWAVLKGST